VSLVHPVRFCLGAVLFGVALLAELAPDSFGPRATWMHVQLGLALVTVVALAVETVRASLRSGWRAAAEDVLVLAGALFTLSAGLVDWAPWRGAAPDQARAFCVLVATPGIAMLTWGARWLEAALQAGFVRRLEPLRQLALAELGEVGPRLWGDGRKENTAPCGWRDEPDTEPLGARPVPGKLDLLTQVAATRGDGASPTGRDVRRWSTLLMASSIPVALALLLALVHWDRDPTISLLLAAATVLALNPRALRRGWLGPFLAAAGRAARRGILFRDGAALEATARSHWVVFDAQSALTRGEPRVTSVICVGDLDEGELLALVAGVEKAFSNDPLGNAIIELAQQRGIVPVQVRLARRVPGMGVTAASTRGDLLVGTRQLLLGQGISVAEADEVAAELEARTDIVAFVALAGRIQGVIGLRDERRPGAYAVAGELTDMGVDPVLMTGDGRLTAEALGRELRFEHVRAEVAPDQWASQIAALRDTGHGIAMVARPPRHEETLSAASVGLSLGSTGLEIDATGVALGSEDPSQAVKAVTVARRALRAAKINLFLASALMIAELGLASLALSSLSGEHHGLVLTVAVPLVVAITSAASAALFSWEGMSGAGHYEG
jgi:P-type E1-E2 ATPase